MSQPQGFVDPCFPSYVCRLHKSLYGLKQTPRAWYERFSSYLLGLGFDRSYADSSLFVHFYKGSVTIILLYVYDLVIKGNDCLYSWYHYSVTCCIRDEKFRHITPFLGHRG